MYIPQAEVGDSVLVHTGYALEVLSDEAARAALGLRASIGS
jgi:hydrogenase maturation factor